MLSQIIWLQLKPETRKILAEILNIPKSGGVEVVDGRVVSDGYTPEDLATVSLDKLQEFMSMEFETDFYKIFGALVEKVQMPVISTSAPLELLTQTPEETKYENKNGKSNPPAFVGEIPNVKKNVPVTKKVKK